MRLFFSIFFLFQIFACGDAGKKINQPPQKTIEPVATVADDSLDLSIPPNAIWGYRFQITGYFDRDRKLDTLTEQFFSEKLGQEIPKFLDPDAEDIFDHFEPARKFHPIIRLKSSNSKVPDLLLDSSFNCRGLCFLQNDGDLDGNGTDEISVIHNWNDMSSMNTLYLYTLKDTGWAILASFSCREWQVPELPEASPTYFMWGQSGVNFDAENTSENREKERVLKKFHFIKKIKKGLFRVETFADYNLVKRGKGLLKVETSDLLETDSVLVAYGDPISELVRFDTVRFTGFR